MMALFVNVRVVFNYSSVNVVLVFSYSSVNWAHGSCRACAMAGHWLPLSGKSRAAGARH